jgi:hypothetical protein
MDDGVLLVLPRVYSKRVIHRSMEPSQSKARTLDLGVLWLVSKSAFNMLIERLQRCYQHGEIRKQKLIHELWNSRVLIYPV